MLSLSSKSTMSPISQTCFEIPASIAGVTRSDFPGKGISQSREPTHPHAHRQVLAFDVAGENLKHSVALHSIHNNFCRIHKTGDLA